MTSSARPASRRSCSASPLVHVNTLPVQEVLDDPAWAGRLTDDDRRALTALFWTHVNPYGTFDLDMNTHFDLVTSAGNAAAGQPRYRRLRVSALARIR